MDLVAVDVVAQDEIDQRRHGWPGHLCCPGRDATRGLSDQPAPESAQDMVTKRTFDREGHAHVVTFSCDRRRRLLDHDRAEWVVLGVLNTQLRRQDGRCAGFVVMPDHVHAIVWFPSPDQIRPFMTQGKPRSSVASASRRKALLYYRKR